MTNAALSKGEPDTTGDSLPAPTATRQAAATEPKPRPKRSRSKKSTTLEAATAVERRRTKALGAAIPEPQSPHKTQLGTLLVGAGLGAAVTLSVVALGTRRGKGSALGAALTKTVIYAIANTTPRGSLVNALARAVGNALA
jgi:hypothetical protein